MALISARLKFRRLSLSDYGNMCALESDPEVIRHTPHRFPIPPEKIKERLANMVSKESEYAPLGIWVAETHAADFVGWFMILKRALPFPELGFMILRRHWGQGYTTEACHALINYAFEDLQLPGLSAVTDSGNTPSINVLTKVGFKLVSESEGFDSALNKTTPKKHFELKR
ncbi:MAG: GNAT family N-acetyltransferase [Bdellovibrio sp.]|nr:GNAT family N-acetyltransferase [Bdellovibrio sp.]